MSAMANATPIVTTVTKTTNKEKASDATPRVNIQDFCEEHYEDILPIIMEKARRDKRKEVQTRLNFGENSKKTRRERENSLNSRAENSPARFHPERSRTRGRERRDDRNVFSRLSHRRRSVHERLSDTYSPSTTKSGPSRTDSRDPSHSRGYSLSRERSRMEDRSRGIEESYGDTYSQETKTKYKDRSRDGGRFRSQKKYVKDPVEIHNIKQRDGKTIEDFMEHFKVETGLMKGAPECMRISRFMHGVNNPELTKCLNEHVPKTMEEMMAITTAFIRGEAAAASKKKSHLPYIARRVQFILKKQIEELVRAGKLSHLIKEIKQSRDQTKNGKKEAPTKDKSLAIYMIQPWQRVTKQKLTQSFARISEIKFPPLANSDLRGCDESSLIVIEVEIGGHMIHRMYIDGGSSTEETICAPRWEQLRLSDITIGYADHYTRAWMNFMIVRLMSPYNGIIGRSGIREIQAVPSTAHEMLKFPVDGGIVTIRSTILIPAECATVFTSPKEIIKEAVVRPENFKVAIHPNFPDQEVAIGGTLSSKGRTELCTLLKENLDIFAWQPSDMTGVPRSVAEHRLNLREGYSPVRQKKRGQAPDRARAIQIEVHKLVRVGIMREVYYHDWLSNPVMVKKHDGSWRMCVDFTDLNKACPQDCYPLPEINWKVESLCGYPFKCFLDAYKGYHQIQMAESDEEKTAFHTSQGVYCYTKMPFGLKNASATYQRLLHGTKMLRDIEETFHTLRKINMKLNPKKCTFGAVEGMFLGYTITPEGIKPCPDKTESVLQLPSLRTIKEVQSLNGKLASLNRFLSKSAKKSLPLFKTLKKCIKKSDFHWTPEAEQAFKQLKQHLAVLMTERGTFQTPIYFISRALQGPELNYTPMEKLILSLVFAAKRLRRAVTEVEHHARRTQYHIPFEDVGERTDTGGLSRREAERYSARHISCKNPAEAADTIHRRIIMCRWITRESDPEKPGRDGVYLRVTISVYRF
ncbi:reverse transcriptase domain-containing protein [Tanacetum coccineum]